MQKLSKITSITLFLFHKNAVSDLKEKINQFLIN